MEVEWKVYLCGRIKVENRCSRRPLSLGCHSGSESENCHLAASSFATNIGPRVSAINCWIYSPFFPQTCYFSSSLLRCDGTFSIRSLFRFQFEDSTWYLRFVLSLFKENSLQVGLRQMCPFSSGLLFLRRHS